MVERANEIFEDGPGGKASHPDKAKLRAWGTWLESFVTAIGANSGSVYPTRASLFADLARPANAMAWVVDDDTVAYNGIYRKSGAVGAGAWSRLGDLPISFIVGTDIGTGTANAIKAETVYPVSESALIIVNVFRSNTSANVTISFNGGAALPVKTSSGNNPSVGGLPANMRLMGVISDGTFRMVNDQASAAAVENSAIAAAASQVAAASSASTANTRATASQTSATNSANSATASEASRQASGTSATNAANSATASEASRQASATSATNSANSATASQTARTGAESARTGSEAARDAAQVHATNAGNSAASASGSANTATTKATEATTARDLSYKWASEAENTQVNDGTRSGYSAYHWSKKAEVAAGGGVPSWAGYTGVITLAQAQSAIAALPLAGGTLSGRLVLPASTTASAMLQLPHGVAPAAPVNGEVWTTTAGLAYRINGVTRQAYDAASMPTVTPAIADAGTDTAVRAWTAALVARAAKAAFPVFVSGQQAFTPGSPVSVAHGLGVVPSEIILDFVCTTADAGYQVGDVVKIYPAHAISNNGLTAYSTTVNVILQMSSAAISFGTKSGGVGVNITPASWRIVVRAKP